ncbi:putative phage holin [compost metagenome]
MTEPGSGAVVAAGVVGIGASSLLIPGVDMNAVVGAFGGALFFVLWARDLGFLARLGYLLVSWIAGYYVAAEMVGREWAQFSGLPALIAAAGTVTALIGALEWMKGGKMPGWLKLVLAWARAIIGAGGRNG